LSSIARPPSLPCVKFLLSPFIHSIIPSFIVITHPLQLQPLLQERQTVELIPKISHSRNITKIENPIQDPIIRGGKKPKKAGTSMYIDMPCERPSGKKVKTERLPLPFRRAIAARGIKRTFCRVFGSSSLFIFGANSLNEVQVQLQTARPKRELAANN